MNSLFFDVILLLALAALSTGIYLEFGLSWCLIDLGAILLIISLIGARNDSKQNIPTTKRNKE